MEQNDSIMHLTQDMSGSGSVPCTMGFLCSTPVKKQKIPKNVLKFFKKEFRQNTPKGHTQAYDFFTRHRYYYYQVCTIEIITFI